MTFSNILLKLSPPVAVLTLNRPDKLNALNTATFDELDVALDEISQNHDIRGLLVQGAGDKAFVAGADISEIVHLDEQQGRVFSEHGQRVFDKIELLNKPVIALIDGFALGGGCELALACHLRIATSRSRFGQPEVNLGLIPGYGATQRLPRLIGKGLALQYLLTAEMISAQRAYEIGLINLIVEPEELENSGQKIMNTILSKGPLAVRHILKLVHSGLDMSLAGGLKMESEFFGKTCASQDKAEGTQAFLEKRKPHFKGC